MITVLAFNLLGDGLPRTRLTRVSEHGLMRKGISLE